MPSLVHLLRLSLLFLLLILLAYWQALRVSFLSDDFVLLSAARLRSLPDTFAIDPNWFFYRPLGTLAWWLQYRILGYNGALYHAFSLGLHWLNSLLVVALARRFLPQRHALGAGLVFALLPLHSETVTWLAAQYDLLATCGYLAALICLLRWADPPNPQHVISSMPGTRDTQRAIRTTPDKEFAISEEIQSGRLVVLARSMTMSFHHPVAYYLAALLAFQLSLWSKEVAFTFPLVAAMLLMLLPERPLLRRLMLALLPFCAVLGLNLLQRYLAWGRIGDYSQIALLPADILQTFGRTALTLLAPLNQLVFPHWLVFGWAAVVALLLLVGLIRLPYRRAMLCGLLWLVMTLAPVLGLLPIGADLQNARVLYLPSIGFCLILAASLDGRLKTGNDSTRFVIRQLSAVFRPSLLLTLAGLLALQFQLGPWVVAGQNARQVLQEFHRLAPLFPPDSRVSAVNLPDNYLGAYVYRLGLNHAYGHFFQQTFALEPLAALTPLRYDLRGTEAQVQFSFDESTKRWGVSALHSVGDDRPLQPGEQRWNITACPTEWRSATCAPGVGATGWLESPLLEQSHVGWYEVILLADVPASDLKATLLVTWRGNGEADWVASRAVTFNLPVSSGTYAYRLVLNPADGGMPLDKLRVELNRGAIRVVALRAVQ